MTTKPTDALLQNVEQIAAGNGDGKIANIMSGGQLGVGAQLPKIDAATPQVFTPAVIIVTHTPSMFQSISNADAILKSLIERHAKSVTGIDFGYTLEGAPVPAGHDGQELNMPTNSKRTPIAPSFVFPEIMGNLVWNFFKFWISMIRHPDTHGSALSAIFNDETFDPMVFSSFSMDLCVIQFDTTMRPENIVDGFMVTNMWPQETGMFGLQREIGVTQLQDRTIPFFGVMQHNQNTYKAAKSIAEALNLHKANYDVSTPISDAIASRLQDKGLSQEITEIASEFQEIT